MWLRKSDEQFYRAILCIGLMRLCRRNMSVCLFVRPSDAGIVSKKHINKLFPPSDSQTIVVSHLTAILRPGPPNGCVKCKGYQKVAIFDQYLACVGNDTR